MTNKYNYTKFIPLALILIFAGTAKAHATETPIRRGGDLNEINSEIDRRKSSVKELDNDIINLEKKTKKTQNNLVDAASSIRQIQKELNRLNDEINIAKQKQSEIKQRISVNYEHSAELITLLERIKRTPPEALILKPDAPYKTAQASMLLKHLLPYLNDQAEDFLEEYNKLEELETELKNKQFENKQLLADSQTKKKQLEKLTSLRSQQLKSKKSQIKEQEKYITKLGEQAQDVEELLVKIERGKKEKRIIDLAKRTLSLKPPTHKKSEPKAPILTRHYTTTNSSGTTPIAPAQGIVRVNFGEKDIYDAKSEGVKIETSKDALVVTPMEGTIRYAGSFRGYNNLIMIEHDNNYHSLISGMNEINVVVGQHVILGEPIGTAGTTTLKDQPSIYYELRHNGQPTKPSRKITALGS